MHDNIRIILVNTSHPGNIGAAARAMKTMCLSDLCLVDPKADFPCADATARAAGADDILENCTVVPTLAEAVADCQLIIGTSARLRHLPVTMLDSRECGLKAHTESQDKKIAILFGREHAGLTNEELGFCHYHVHVPTNPEYSSLNLAAAVQIICYEIRLASLGEKMLPEAEAHDELASNKDVQLFYQQLQTTLEDINFIKNSSPRKIMARLTRLFNRTQLEKMEYDLLMGVLNSIQKVASGVDRG